MTKIKRIDDLPDSPHEHKKNLKKPKKIIEDSESESEVEPKVDVVIPPSADDKKKKRKKKNDEQEIMESKKKNGLVQDNQDNPKKKRKKKENNSPKKESKKNTEELMETKKEENADEEEEDDTYKWWEDSERDDSIKWDTLEHNGVFFPPEYEPHGVKLLYDGKPVELSPNSEEVAGFFAALINTPYAENKVFCKNFFDDFLTCLQENDPNSPIKEFSKCNFSLMHEYFEKQKELKKNKTKEEKEKLKQEKKVIDEKYGIAVIDGRKEKIGNFRIEPPGLFRGRGDHPKTGKLKLRVMPEQVTINIGKEAKVPEPPVGHSWGGVVHDNTVAWLATWNENINNNTKYVLFAAGSSLKGMSDFKKFEKARELKKIINDVRKEYMAQLKDKLMVIRQRATAMWLIDKLALRAGHEKGDDEADTVGCCSLRFEHISLEEDSITTVINGETKTVQAKMVVFDFLGKDSIRYFNRVEVDPVVWKNLKIFKKEPKKEGDPLFDRLTPTSLNKHLNSILPGLTAKVFRTYNASHTFQEELKKTVDDVIVQEKILSYNRANRQVAVLCNHQRAVTKGHNAQMERMDNKILLEKYHRHLVRIKMKEVEPHLKAKYPKYNSPESDMDEETIEKAQEYELELEKVKLEKKYEKMCKKAEEDGEAAPEKPELVLPDKLANYNSFEKLETKFNTHSLKIDQYRATRVDKDENKTTALGTSKINYIDPRITVAWCKRFSVPLDKMFNKSLQEKFKWAMNVDLDWKF